MMIINIKVKIAAFSNNTLILKFQYSSPFISTKPN